jgi:HEAT repeat protein
MRRKAVFLLALAAAGPVSAKNAVKRWASELDGADLPRQIVAARTLGRMGDKDGVDPLLNRLDVRRCSPRLTAAIVESLGKLKDPKALDPLMGAWDYLNSTRLQLGSEMPGNLQTLRALIVEAVGEIGTDRAAPLLEEAIGDKDQLVVQKAALGLGNIKDARSVDALMGLLSKGGNLAQAGFEALGRLGDPRGTTALLGYLKSEDGLSQVQAAYGLSFHDKTYTSTLAALMREEKLEMSERILAAYYLAKQDNRWGLEFLGGLARKSRPLEQLKAIEALGKCGRERAVGPLVEALQNSDPNVRLLVTQALGRLGGPKAVNALKRLHDDRSMAVRAAAKQALDEINFR